MWNIQYFLIENPLIELWLITLILVAFGFVAKTLRQPILVWYILGWLLLGPQGFNIIHHYENIQFYAHFWVSLLLFMVWLGLNPWIIKEVWKVSAIAGIGQVVFTSVIGYLLSIALWFEPIIALFIAISLTFSSTIVIVKLVSDRWDSATTYWKIALWILIVQDIIAMLILLAISTSTIQLWDQSLSVIVAEVLLKVFGLLTMAIIFAKYILPATIAKLAKQKELLLLFVISRAILFGWLRYYAWFSMEIWALLAGIALASSRYRFHIFSELRPFRDFFLALFFVYLWGQILFDNMWSVIIPIILFSLFVLIWNPIIVIWLMMKLGYWSKDSFMTWLTVAQISEFSFIVVWLALTAGIIDDPNILSMVTIIWLITMTGSSYMFTFAPYIFEYVKPLLSKFEQSHVVWGNEYSDTEYTVIVMWFWRLWKFISAKLKEHQIPFCIIDNDIKKVESAENEWYNAMYADMQDTDTLSNVVSKKTKLLYSTVANHDIDLQLLTNIWDSYDNIKCIVVASYLDEAESLYHHNADYVIFPHMSWAKEGREVIQSHFWEPEKFISSKLHNREQLSKHKFNIE